MEDIDFTGKVVIVTGASSGIGAETARLFAEYNAKLSLIGRDASRLGNTARECQIRNGLEPLRLVLDLTYSGSCEIVVNKTVEKYGRIDVLVNCAGKFQTGSVFDKSMEAFDELMAINLRVPYHLTQLVLPHLLKTKGNIVNVGSSQSKRHYTGLLPYLVSKSSLDKFSKHAATELAEEKTNVRINVVSPGVTTSSLMKNLSIDEEYKPLVYNTIAEHLPNGKIVEPREVATLICLTASDKFPNMTGSNFFIDGGACMS